MGYIVEDFLEGVRLSGFMPDSDSTFTDAKLITYTSDELFNTIVPHIMTARQDYFLTSKVIPLVANQRFYTLPSRAVGGAFKDIMVIPDSSRPLDRYPLPKIDPHNLNQWSNDSSNSIPRSFYISGDEIVLSPTPNAAVASIEVFYYRRPSQLISTSSCAKITGVSSAGGLTTFTVDTDLTSSLSVGSKIDLVSSTAPFLSWADSVSITAITTTTIEVSTSNIDDENGNVEPQVNDYICPDGFSNYPQLPIEYHTILQTLVASECMRAMGAAQNYAMLKQKGDAQLNAVMKLIANRVEDEVDVVCDRNSILNNIGGGFVSFRRF